MCHSGGVCMLDTYIPLPVTHFSLFRFETFPTYDYGCGIPNIARYVFAGLAEVKADWLGLFRCDSGNNWVLGS